MARPRYQNGSLVVRGKKRKVWLLRWREDVLGPDGAARRIQRAETLGPISTITRQKARAVLQDRVVAITRGQRRPQATMILDDFVRMNWRPTAELALKKSSVRYYSFQLDRYISPTLGSVSLCDLSRGQIEACLSSLSQNGHADATVRCVRPTLSTVLQAAVERGYINENPAHGIRIRETNAKTQRRFYSPVQVRQRC
jgi:hypothetical protein